MWLGAARSWLGLLASLTEPRRALAGRAPPREAEPGRPAGRSRAGVPLMAVGPRAAGSGGGGAGVGGAAGAVVRNDGAPVVVYGPENHCSAEQLAAVKKLNPLLEILAPIL